MSEWIVPPLADLAPGVIPTGFRVLVAMAEKPERTTGGIILPASTHEREQWGADHARLVAVSPIAFSYHKDWPEGSQPQAGQVVFVGRYPGDEVIGRDGRKYRLINDTDIDAIIEEQPNG